MLKATYYVLLTIEYDKTSDILKFSLINLRYIIGYSYKAKGWGIANKINLT